MPVALVTGASEGLGRAIALALAERGWLVVVDARRAGPLRAVVEAAPAGSVVAVPGDVSDPSHRDALVDELRRLGRLDLLVANAGTLGPSPLPPLARLETSQLEEVLGVNVVAQLGLLQSTLPLLTASRGTVVTVTSDAAVEAYETWGAYGASKAALEQLTAVFGAEHADLRVYRFDPGDMRTRMHQDAFPGEDISDRPEPESVVPAFLALLEGAPPSGRYRAGDLVPAAP